MMNQFEFKPTNKHVMRAIEYINIWYPLPPQLPFEIKFIIYEFTFDPNTDPW